MDEIAQQLARRMADSPSVVRQEDCAGDAKAGIGDRGTSLEGDEAGTRSQSTRPGGRQTV